MKLTTRLILAATIIVTVTDFIAFIHIKNNPELITIPYIILWIIVTMVPIAINILYSMRKSMDDHSSGIQQ